MYGSSKFVFTFKAELDDDFPMSPFQYLSSVQSQVYNKEEVYFMEMSASKCLPSLKVF